MKRSPQDDNAEAFRLGYERARRAFEPTVAIDRDEMTSLDELLEPAPGASEAAGASYDDRAPRDRRPSARTRLLGGAALAVLLVVAAFGVGRLVAGPGDDAPSSAAVASEGGPAPGGNASPYAGAVTAVDIRGAEATCESGASVDAAGNPVTYEPAKAHDADLSTAWRCDGSGAGQQLTLLLPAGTEIGELGLVPGYAKTDPANGVDRYAENNRITRVRWHFADGSTVVQKISADPADRSMRTIRVPATASDRVVLEILESAPGRRDTVAVSEVRVAAAG